MATKVDIVETSLTAQQQKEFWRLAAISGSHVNRDSFQAYLEQRNPFEVTPIARAVEKFLESAGSVVVNITESAGPSNFLKTRKGLWVEDSFAQLFIDDDVQSAGQMTLSKHMVRKNALGSQIRRELPSNHEFEAYEFCQILIQQLTMQWGGKSGALLNNGYANIFYVWNKQKTRRFVVGVLWRGGAGYHEWSVRVWELDGRRWLAGRSVFSRN